MHAVKHSLKTVIQWLSWQKIQRCYLAEQPCQLRFSETPMSLKRKHLVYLNEAHPKVSRPCLTTSCYISSTCDNGFIIKNSKEIRLSSVHSTLSTALGSNVLNSGAGSHTSSSMKSLKGKSSDAFYQCWTHQKPSGLILLTQLVV